jgi:hypothetical protein
LLKNIAQQKAKLDQRERRIRARRNHANRKKDARGKVLLGVVLLEIIKNQPDRVNWCMMQIRKHLSKSSDLAFLKELYDLPLSTQPLPQTPPPSETPVSDPS